MEVDSDILSIILRQTDYTEQEATQKLQEHKGDGEAVIRTYLNVLPKKGEKERDPTQVIYSEIGQFMSTVSSKPIPKK